MVEMVCIWSVSATFDRRYDFEPLQDNVDRVFRSWLLPEQVASLQRFIRTCHIHHFTVFALYVAVTSIKWGITSSPRHLTKFGARTLYAVSLTRVIRMTAFMLTVVPSRKPNCFVKRFVHEVPTEWLPWIYQALHPVGGCNDLIVSGHGTIMGSFAVFVSDVAGSWTVSIFIWTLVLLECINEVLGKSHYAVDMFLGVVVSILAWHSMQWIEDGFPDAATVRKDPRPSNRMFVVTALAIVVATLLSELFKNCLPTLVVIVVAMGLVVKSRSCELFDFVIHLLIVSIFANSL